MPGQQLYRLQIQRGCICVGIGEDHEASPPKRMKPKARLSNVMKMLAKKAVQNPETVKPRINFDTSINSKALITRRKSPKLSKVKGKVKTISTGRKMALTKPSIKAETINEDVSANRIPLNT